MNFLPAAYLQQAFGLSFLSQRKFSELGNAPVKSAFPPVELFWNTEISSLASPGTFSNKWQICPGSFSMELFGLAHFHVTTNRITVSAEQDAPDEAIRLILFGSPIAALLHMKGVLALHGSAIKLPGKGAALFTGVSTAGKSTLAVALSQRGYPFLADDLAAVHFDTNGRAWLYPGLARCKLWGNTMDKLNINPDSSERIYPDLEKYSITIKTSNNPEPLAFIYELSPHENSKVTISPVKGIDKLRLLDKQTYRSAFIKELGLKSEHLKRLEKLAAQVPIGKIIRPNNKFSSIDSIISLLEHDWI